MIEILDKNFYRINGKAYPRITWINSYYPKDRNFYKWLASKGWDEAEEIKETSAESGTKLHSLMNHMLNGSKIEYYRDGVQQFDDKEWMKLQSFVSWYNDTKPDEIEYMEQTVHYDSKKLSFAGTFDLMYIKDDIRYLIDFKTGNGVYPSMNLQLAAYKYAFEQTHKGKKIDVIGILHLGTKHKRHYNLILEEDKFKHKDYFEKFKAVYQIFRNENPVLSPNDKTFESELSLDLNNVIL